MVPVLLAGAQLSWTMAGAAGLAPVPASDKLKAREPAVIVAGPGLGG